MVRVLQHHTVVRDKWHNMTVDLAFWRDYYWIVYRRVSGHYDIDGVAVVLRSVDLKRWQKITEIDFDSNCWSPRFCVTDDNLFVYFFGASLLDRETRNRSSYCSMTHDGISWSKPKPILTNQWIYSARSHKGKIYATAYSWQGEIHDRIHGPLNLLSSDDGFHWTKISTIAGFKDRVNEADFVFMPNEELWVISATWMDTGRWMKNEMIGTWPGPKNYSLFFSSKPPYQTWERTNLQTTIHSPSICTCNGIVYVAGRREMYEPWIPQPIPAGNTGIFTVEKGKVTPFFALPSIGDMWQPGLISKEPGKLIICYNSQHAYLDGIIPSYVPLPFVERPIMGENDIYLAEIKLE